MDAGTSDLPCVAFDAGRSLGRVDRPELNEISGLVASRRHSETFYVHNDSGDGARFFVIDGQAAVRGEFLLDGVAAFDWEDIALGPGPDPNLDWIYLGDVGDNFARLVGQGRQTIEVLRVAEPPPMATPMRTKLTSWQRLVFTYPDQPHDCEAIAVETSSGDLYFATKEDDGHSHLLVARAPHLEGPRVLEEVAQIDLSTAPNLSGRYATAMDIDTTGSALIVRTYSGARLYRREPGTTWAAAMTTTPQILPVRTEMQGESVAFLPGSLGYFTVSEGETPDLWYFEQVPCP